MSSRRSKVEIYLTVLKAIRDGESRPTRIMYSANLSWKPLTQILDSLEKEELIKPIEEGCDGRSKNRYGITEKGESVLGYFEKTKEIFEIESLPVY